MFKSQRKTTRKLVSDIKPQRRQDSSPVIEHSFIIAVGKFQQVCRHIRWLLTWVNKAVVIRKSVSIEKICKCSPLCNPGSSESGDHNPCPFTKTIQSQPKLQVIIVKVVTYITVCSIAIYPVIMRPVLTHQ